MLEEDVRETTVATCPGVTASASDRLAWLRALVPVTYAIVGIDLADDKQAAVVTDQARAGTWK